MVLRTSELRWFLSGLVHSFFYCLFVCLFVRMPLKRSSGASAQDQLFLIHSLTKSLCSSPEEDLKKQSLLAQEDDSGIKSGNLASTPGFFFPQSNANALISSFFLGLDAL